MKDKRRMTMRKIAFAFIALSLAMLLYVVPAQAQATRTWVSGVGDDANPCSRTAPCKTFAGAISKTAPGGEINVLDPGGFGAVTITKSITISSEGFEAGVLVSGTNGIIINALSTDVVVLRGLDIEGLGTGLDGIKVLGTLGALHVEKCTINDFRGTAANGIEIATTSGTTQVFIKDTKVRNTGQPAATLSGGILINPTGSASVKASLDNVTMEFNNFGIQVRGTSNTMVNRSVAAGNVAAGYSNGGSGTATTLSLFNSVAANNGSFGVVCGPVANTAFLNNTIFFANGTAPTTGTCS
jgi:nitrous oxidase accessory protein NosD